MRTGSVILEDVNEPVLYKFSFTQEDGYYRKVWRRERPSISNIVGIRETRGRKYLSVMDDVILQPVRSDIIGMFHHDDMKLIDKWQLTDVSDQIITCLPGPRAVFAIHNDDSESWHIEIKEQTCTLMSLRPSGHQWQNLLHSGLSACEYPNTGIIAVIEASLINDSGSLDMFSCDGM